MPSDTNLNISSTTSNTLCNNKTFLHPIDKLNGLMDSISTSECKNKSSMLANANSDDQKRSKPAKISDRISSSHIINRMESKSPIIYHSITVTATVDDSDEGMGEDDCELVNILEHNIRGTHSSSLSLFEASNISGRANPAIPTEEVFGEYFREHAVNSYYGRAVDNVFSPIVTN